MDALISGRGGVALVVDGDRIGSIHAAEPERLIPRRPGELRFLIGEGKDFVSLENVSQEEITRELLQARASEEALLLALAVLDADVPSDLRSEVVKDLDVLLADERVAVSLEDVLYAELLPEEADMKSALAVARKAEAKRVLSLYEFLWTRQEDVKLVRTAWNAVPRKLFGSERQRWQFHVVREGIFRSLVLATAMGRDVRELFAAATALRTLQSLPNCHELLQAWFDPFFQRYPVAREMDPEGDCYGQAVAESTVKYEVAQESQGRSRDDESFNAPRGEVEKALAEVWSEVLGVERIGVDDNFFDLGGHSLLAIELVESLRKDLAPDLSVVDFFRVPTISALAQHLQAIDSPLSATRATNRQRLQKKTAKTKAKTAE